MNKRGISPLIATVLIIGFTIVIAALVFQWGGNYFQSSTSETSQEAERAIAMTGIEINLKEATFGHEGINLLIESKTDKQIEGLKVRFTGDKGSTIVEVEEAIDPFATKRIPVNYYENIGEIQKIDIFARVMLNNEIVLSSNPLLTEGFREDEIEEPIDDHTVAYWKFDEGNGTIVYDSIGNNDGTISGTVNWTTGKYKGALRLDGIANFVQIPHNYSYKPTDEITIEAWIYPYDVTTSREVTHGGTNILTFIIGNYGDGLYFITPTAGSPRFVGNFTTGLIQTGEWQHIAATYNGSDLNLYLNGEKIGVANYPPGLTYSVNDLYFGYNQNIHYLNAIVDEVKISNIAREF